MRINAQTVQFDAPVISLTDEQGNEFVIKERRGGGISVWADGDITICPDSANEIDIYEL